MWNCYHSVLEVDEQCLTKASAFGRKDKSSILTQKGSLQYHANTFPPQLLSELVIWMCDIIISDVNKTVYLEYPVLGVTIM